MMTFTHDLVHTKRAEFATNCFENTHYVQLCTGVLYSKYITQSTPLNDISNIFCGNKSLSQIPELLMGCTVCQLQTVPLFRDRIAKSYMIIRMVQLLTNEFKR